MIGRGDYARVLNVLPCLILTDVCGTRLCRHNVDKTHFHNANLNNPDTKNNFTIPVMVKGRALTSKNNPVSRQSSKFSHKKDHKVVIIRDRHARLCATNNKYEIKDNYNVQGLVKPGAGAGILLNIANGNIADLTKNGVVIFCGGANDVAKTTLKWP